MTEKDKKFCEIFNAYSESGAPIGMQEIMRIASEAGYTDEEISKLVSEARSESNKKSNGKV